MAALLYYDSAFDTTGCTSGSSLTYDTLWGSTVTNAITGRTPAYNGTYYSYVLSPDVSPVHEIGPGQEYKLPDGARLIVDADGNYRIEDAEARVTYRAHRNRDFNPFVNAGDQLARFIEYVGRVAPGLSREEVTRLPIRLFAHWLIMEAAARDDDPVPADVERPQRLLTERVRPRCLLPTCRRFIRRDRFSAGFNYCDADHAGRHVARLAAA